MSLSLQLVSHALTEPLLVQAGTAFERATDWHAMHPPGWKGVIGLSRNTAARDTVSLGLIVHEVSLSRGATLQAANSSRIVTMAL